MKTALITGSNSGFGYHTTLELLKADFCVIATMRNLNNKDKLVEKAKEINKDKYLIIEKLDVTNREETTLLFERIKSNFNQLDVLINNAGFCIGGFSDDVALEDMEKQFSTNVFSILNITQTFLPLLENSNEAKIINIGSVSGIIGFPGMIPYASSKFALEGLSESLRLELSRKSIFVSIVQPASYKTDIWDKTFNQMGTANIECDLKNSILSQAKFQSENSSDPQEVAKLIKKICKTKKPKLRYPIGKGAKTLSLFKRILPFSFIEFFANKKLK